MIPDLDSLTDLSRTATLLKPYVRHTPLERCDELSERAGFSVSLKLECWQVTGSFKPRVSFSKLLWAAPEERARGVTASTAGGHGVGLAFAARALQVPCHIHVGKSADPIKVGRARSFGAQVVEHATHADATAAASAMAQSRGMMLVPAFNDRAIIAGGATIGLEVFADGPDIDAFCVGIGGGGLAAGLAQAARVSGRTDCGVFGVQPEATAVLNHWLRAGRSIPVTPHLSIADGLGALVPADVITFPLLQRNGVTPLDVSDAEIVDAMRWAFDTLQLVLEPSGAAPIAALWKHHRVFRERGVTSLALVLTGRVINPQRWHALFG